MKEKRRKKRRKSGGKVTAKTERGKDWKSGNKVVGEGKEKKQENSKREGKRKEIKGD